MGKGELTERRRMLDQAAQATTRRRECLKRREVLEKERQEIRAKRAKKMQDVDQSKEELA